MSLLDIFFLAAALAVVKRHEEARDAAIAGPVLDSSFTIRRFRASAASENLTYLADASASLKECAGRRPGRDDTNGFEVGYESIASL
jgi:hypothetical protein